MFETLAEILHHRVLVWSLVQRQLAVRYRGSVLGFVWTFLNPLCVMLVYTLVFSIFVRDPSIEHYGTFVFCGLLPWIWFSSVLLEGSNAIVGGGTLITKALFPPQILPTVTSVSHAVNFLLSLPMLVPFLIQADRPFTWALVALPVVIAVQLMLTFAIVLGVSALNVHYRDVQHILGNLLSLWFFLTPVIYSEETAQKRYWVFYVVVAKINPMGALVGAYHDILYWGRFPNWRNLGLVALGSVLILMASHAIFRSYRDGFAEEILMARASASTAPSTASVAPPPAVELVGITKRFRKRTLQRGYTTVKTHLLRSMMENLFTRKIRRGNYLTALDDIDLRIEEGTTVGIIGHNGSGKSTLLKVMTGIYKPDAGQIRIRGRVSALIELGAGFHPEFTGRENIYLNGLVLGLKKDYIQRKFEEIVAFADLEDFIDDPVRTYSSGMYMRLGFSIAIHVDPDILIVDEVLAVGDEAFIHKCQERVADFKRRGKTIVVVTHDLGSIERWCDEVVLLDHGKMVERGGPRRVIDAYRRMVAEVEERRLAEEHRRAAELIHQEENAAGVAVRMDEVASAEVRHPDQSRWGTREIEITNVRLLDATGAERYVYESGEAMSVAIHFTMHKPVPPPVFGVGLFRPDGLCCYGTNTDIDRAGLAELPEEGTVVCALENLDLVAGDYLVDVAVHAEDGYAYDYHTRRWSFAVRSSVADVGVYRPRHAWSLA